MTTIYRPRIAPLFALLFLACGSTAYAETRAARAAFLSALETAANHGDVATLRASAAPGTGGAFEWVTAGDGIFSPVRPWKALWLTPPGSPAESAYVAFTRYQVAESAGDHLYRVLSTPAGLRLAEELPETETGGYRVRDHRLDVRFDMPAHTVRIADQVTVTRSPQAAVSLLLRLNAIYTIDSVKLAGRPVPFRQAGGFVALPAPRAARGVYDLRYHGRPGDSNEDFILPREAALTSYWYPNIGRLPATHAVRITVPRGWIAIGQGDRLSEETHGRETTTAWRNLLPVSYFTVAAGQYTVSSRKVGNLLVSAYLLHPNPDRAERAISAAADGLQWFGSHFSPYPYTHYTVVESDLYPAALECYSFTLAGKQLIPAAIVHEVSHTWWGGLLPNTYTRSMWNEALAEYSDGLHARQTGRDGMHDYDTKMMAGGMATVIRRVSLAAACDSMNMAHAAVGYGKGSLVLENLERLIGTPTMLACLQRFLASRKPGEAVEWADLIDAVARTAGPVWRGYFPAWLDRTDLPNLQLRDVRTVQEGPHWRVTGTITQDGTPFWIQVPLVVRTDRGEVRQKIDIRSASVPFHIETEAAPTRLLLDPKVEALRAIQGRLSPPTLASLQTDGGPLLVVYATGGSDEENAAAKQLAEVQAKEVAPFATVTPVADTKATPEQMESASVLFLGRPDSLRLPPEWRARLPLDATEAAIQYRHRRWTGTDLWALAITAHPNLPRGFLAQTLASGPSALRDFVHQGDLDSQKSLFVVRGTRVQAADTLQPPDPTVVELTP